MIHKNSKNNSKYNPNTSKIIDFINKTENIFLFISPLLKLVCVINVTMPGYVNKNLTFVLQGKYSARVDTREEGTNRRIACVEVKVEIKN